jgi:hypothetical protein
VTPFFIDRECAALAWTEAVTLVAEGYVSDAVYEEARRHFSEEELVHPTMSWSRSMDGIGRRSRFGRFPARISPRRGRRKRPRS